MISSISHFGSMYAIVNFPQRELRFKDNVCEHLPSNMLEENKQIQRLKVTSTVNNSHIILITFSSPNIAESHIN
jgi:hypothetical protein